MSGRVVVVGAGAAGMAAAWRLSQAGVDVRVLEAADRVGGCIGTVELNGHRFERGPTTVLESSDALAELIGEVGLGGEVVYGNPEAKRRLIWYRGAVHPLPMSPPALVKSELLSPRAKLRLLAEPLQRAPRAPGRETLQEFLTRRIGREAVDALVDPFVTGVFAGRPDQLGVDAFPMLAELEREHGGLVVGMVRRMIAARRGGQPRPGRRLMSLRGGLARLPEAIAKVLGERLSLGWRATRLERTAEGWTVHGAGGESEDAATLVLATPAWVTGELLGPLDDAAPRVSSAIPQPHVARVGLGYEGSQIRDPINAFGLLRQSGSPLGRPGLEAMLGVLFSSTIFDDRAPEGAATLSVILGGAHYPESVDMSDDALVGVAREALELLIGASGEPRATLVSRWTRGIPQYLPGHAERIAELRARVRALGRLHLAGNYLDGVSVDKATRSGMDAATAALRGAI